MYSLLGLIPFAMSQHWPHGCGAGGPSPCGDKPCLPKFPHSYNMQKSTIFMPCNYSGHYNPEVAAKFGIVDFDWSNEKDQWVNDSPMTCKERLLEQAKLIKAINNETKIWVYRESVAAQPWYTDVREKLLSNPDWFLKFDPSKKGNYTVPQCDNNFNPPRCSDLYHDQVQTPNYPVGDGSCDKPCDCGVPCGRYLWDTRNPDLVDWLVNTHLTGDVAPSELVNGVFLDDDWSNTGGAAENCVLNDCQHDMGLSTRDVADITDGWCNMMKQTQATILDKGGFDWRMFSPGSGTCSGPPFAAGELTEGIEGAAGLLTCTEYMRQECSSGPNSTLQKSAMMYGMGKGCSLVTDKATGYPVDFEQHLASFLVLRGPYAWLGWAWVGCSGNRGKGSGSVPLPPTPKEMFATDYGTPTGICKETAVGSGIFERDWTKATVQVDCNKWEGKITMKATGKSVFEDN